MVQFNPEDDSLGCNIYTVEKHLTPVEPEEASKD